MWLTLKLILERRPNSHFSANHGDNENDQDNENYSDNKNEGKNPANKYMFKVNNKKKIFCVFLVIFENISHLVLVFLISISNM